MSDDPFGDALAAGASAQSAQDDPFGAALAEGAAKADQPEIRMPDGSKYTGQPWQDALLKSRNPGGHDTPIGVVSRKLIGGVTGSAAEIASGYHGLYDLATGKGVSRAGSDVEGDQSAASMPDNPNAFGGEALAQDAMNHPANPLNWVGDIGKGTQWGLNKAGVDPILSEAGGRVVSEVGPYAIGLAGARKLPKGPSGVVESEAEPVSSMDHPESLSAAKSSVDLSKASPELRTAVETAQAIKSPLHEPAVQAHVEAESLPVPIRLTRGQATGDPNIITAELNARAKTPELATRFQEQNRALADNVKAIRDQVGPDVFSTNPYEHGQALIESYQAKDAPIKADIEAKYKALEEANGGTFPVDGQAFANNAYSALRQKLKTSFLPSSIESDLGRFKNGEPMSFEDFEAMRTNLAAEMRKAARTEDGNAEMAASIVRDSLEQLPLSPGAASLKPLADAARGAAKARFDAFRADPAYEAAVEGTITPDRFVNEFVTGNGKKANVGQLQIMRRNLGDNPVAVQTLKVAETDALRDAARIKEDGTGNFSQDGYNRLMQAHGARLKVLMEPGELETLQQLGRTAYRTQTRPTGTHAFVSNSQTLGESFAEHAKGMAEGYINAKTGGLAGPIIDKIKGGAAEKANRELLKQTLEPGAGIIRKKP